MNSILVFLEILRKYFDVVIWPQSPMYIEKTAGTTDGGDLAPEVKKQLNYHEVDAFHKFRMEAIAWFNDWGNDTRGRK